MKKLILAVVALTGVCGMANANQLQINNNTPCTFDLSIGGIGSSGPTVAVPGTSFFNSTPPSSGISAVKILFTDVAGNLGGTAVGNSTPFGSTMGMPAPACPTPFGYITAIWQTLPSGDVVLTIL